jgi:tRNA 2-selenouridine synthase
MGAFLFMNTFVNMRRVQIEEFIKESGGALLLDVRSPSEYNHAHIPGATSFPLFTDEERKVVGTAYKQKSREAAIKIGLDFFGPKMRGMVEKVEELMVDRWPMERRMTVTDQRTTVNVFIYCWRGGMRSGAVSWLLNMYGFNVTVLAGGYKAFRGYVLQSFELPYHFKILGGYTGSGKTEVLQQLRHAGEAVIDLEGLAAHKGSAFGSINMPPQPTQEMFENRLNSELRKVSGEWSVASDIKTAHTPNPIWLEDESQRIGNLNIPGALWQNMRQSPIYFLDIPFEERLQHITEEYSQCQKQKLADAIERIKKRLGPLETKTALQYLEDSALKDCFRILLHYYDKLYLKGLHSRQNLDALLTNIISETVTSQNACLVSQVQLLQ